MKANIYSKQIAFEVVVCLPDSCLGSKYADCGSKTDDFMHNSANDDLWEIAA